MQNLQFTVTSTIVNRYLSIYNRLESVADNIILYFTLFVSGNIPFSTGCNKVYGKYSVNSEKLQHQHYQRHKIEAGIHQLHQGITIIQTITYSWLKKIRTTLTIYLPVVFCHGSPNKPISGLVSTSVPLVLFQGINIFTPEVES